MSQSPRSLDGHAEPWRQAGVPAREGGIPGPPVKAGVQFHRAEVGDIVLEPVPDGQSRRVQDVLPVVIAPAGGADVDCHLPQATPGPSPSLRSTLWQGNVMARIEDYAVVGDLHT